MDDYTFFLEKIIYKSRPTNETQFFACECYYMLHFQLNGFIYKNDTT